MMVPCPKRSGLRVWFFFTKAGFTTRLTKSLSGKLEAGRETFPGVKSIFFF